MTQYCEQSCFTVSTVPPPPGESDAYSARTRIAPLSEIVLASMGLDVDLAVAVVQAPAPPPSLPPPVSCRPTVYMSPTVHLAPVAMSRRARIWPGLLVVGFGTLAALVTLALAIVFVGV